MISIENLTKKFFRFKAIDNISMKINKNESFALLGPNGAGKTTLVRILSTLLKPSSGEVKIKNYDIVKDREEIKKIIGVVSHNPFLYNELTAMENLEFFAELFEVENSEKKIDELLRIVELHDSKNALVANFSRGMKQRLAIARALLHDPEILILDEPTSGLDINGRKKFYELIGSFKGRKTIFLTTHYLEEAEILCERCAIMNRGKIIAELETKEREKLEEIFSNIVAK